jgi:hypothetical protein
MTWQHDLGVTASRIAFIESPTEWAEDLEGCAVPFRWTPGAPGWVGVLERAGHGAVQWSRVDPCLVSHVLHAHEDGEAVILYVCRYDVPEEGQPCDLGCSGPTAWDSVSLPGSCRCWSAGGWWAIGSSAPRSTIGSSSTRAAIPSSKAAPSATATPWKWLPRRPAAWTNSVYCASTF